MEWLSDISEEVNEIFQGIRACFADIVVGNTISEDLRVVPNGRHNAASRPAITVEIDGTGIGWTAINRYSHGGFYLSSASMKCHGSLK
jgi:hypothetical protein